MPSSLIWVAEGFPYDVCPADTPVLDISGPLVAGQWESHLASHPDRYFVDAIVRIISRGAKVGYIGPSRFLKSKNHSSANEAPEILTADVNKQLAAGRLVVMSSPLPEEYICSPLGLVPKSNRGWGRIHDLSFPRNISGNAFIPTDWGALEYTSFDEAVEALLRQGPGAVFLKEDLADAFRHVPVAISDRWLLGFQWLDIFYMEAFLPFGLRTAPFLFDLFAKALHYILAYVLGWHIVLHYLDDFFTIFPPGTDPAPHKVEW